MSAAHTPGPWRLLPEEVDKPYIRVRGTRLGGRYKIANVVSVVYDCAHEREAQETRANAHLIASAPDLLAERDRLKALNAELAAACAAIVDWDDAENDAPEYVSDNGAHWRMRQKLCTDAFDKARAALAKQKGETE